MSQSWVLRDVFGGVFMEKYRKTFLKKSTFMPEKPCDLSPEHPNMAIFGLLTDKHEAKILLETNFWYCFFLSDFCPILIGGFQIF